MIRRLLTFGFSFALMILMNSVSAQELFNMTEPASTVPKGVLGVKFLSETYNESGSFRNQFSLRLMYGLTSKLTVWAQPMVSNHHGETLPGDLISHRHVGARTVYFTKGIKYGTRYKYSFAGAHFNAKYRFLSLDQAGSHFRMAAIGEYTLLGNQAHDEAEPELQGDTGGYGAGLIATYLKKRLAVSFTGGVVIPNSYEDLISNNNYAIDYANAVRYSLSIGYLVYPKSYESYAQNNYNFYLELMGKSYADAQVTRLGESVNIQSEPLAKGSYLDVFFGVQRIMNSNDRIELSIGFPMISQSYRHFYPLLNLGWQHYFYFD